MLLGDLLRKRMRDAVFNNPHMDLMAAYLRRASISRFPAPLPRASGCTASLPNSAVRSPNGADVHHDGRGSQNTSRSCVGGDEQDAVLGKHHPNQGIRLKEFMIRIFVPVRRHKTSRMPSTSDAFASRTSSISNRP